MRRINPIILIFGVVSIVAAVGLLIFVLLQPDSGISDEIIAEGGTSIGGGSIIDPPQAITDFTLPGDEGEPISISDFQGGYTLISFGYTHCPDVCPLTMLDFKRIKRELGDELAEEVNFLFISVDGERDTPELLDRYLQRYDPAFVGMSGTDDVLETVTDEFGVFYERREGSTEGNYLMDHTASTFMLDPEGRLVRIFSFTKDPQAIADELRVLLT